MYKLYSKISIKQIFIGVLIGFICSIPSLSIAQQTVRKIVGVSERVLVSQLLDVDKLYSMGVLGIPPLDDASPWTNQQLTTAVKELSKNQHLSSAFLYRSNAENVTFFNPTNEEMFVFKSKIQRYKDQIYKQAENAAQ